MFNQSSVSIPCALHGLELLHILSVVNPFSVHYLTTMLFRFERFCMFCHLGSKHSASSPGKIPKRATVCLFLLIPMTSQLSGCPQCPTLNFPRRVPSEVVNRNVNDNFV